MIIQKYLIIANKCGFKGCVIHVPKSTTSNKEDSYNIAKQNIINILENIDCKLILETPAGQGTEMFTALEDFVNFVKLINNSIYFNKLCMCIDTAHVFSTGYLPDEYIDKIIKYFSEDLDLIKLIHFNDSKVCKGSCRDLHETLGRGFIPKNNLLKVAEIANELNIPLVMEY